MSFDVREKLQKEIAELQKWNRDWEIQIADYEERIQSTREYIHQNVERIEAYQHVLDLLDADPVMPMVAPAA